MKSIFFAFALFFLPNLFIVRAINQSISFMGSIKHYNLSKVWCANKLKVYGDEEYIISFPEPFGFIGKNYQRFYLHYISVLKDSANPYKYYVTGKIRVYKNTCYFTGYLEIVKAAIDPSFYYGKYQQGTLQCKVVIDEDKTNKNSGYIRGILTSNWFIDKSGNLHYDSLHSESDGFLNNQVIGTWTSYLTHVTKQCNWGDFRIPNSGDLDIGAGEFSVNDKYLRYGWLTYRQALQQNEPNHKKALAEENRKWWQ